MKLICPISMQAQTPQMNPVQQRSNQHRQKHQIEYYC